MRPLIALCGQSRVCDIDDGLFHRVGTDVRVFCFIPYEIHLKFVQIFVIPIYIVVGYSRTVHIYILQSSGLFSFVPRSQDTSRAPIVMQRNRGIYA
jgi:hypothetical protein